MKLEAVMEHLQRQQQARLEMERKERRLRDAHLMYAQQVAAQHAILAAARASALGSGGKAQVHGVALERPDEAAHGRDLGNNEDGVDADNDDDEEAMADEGSEGEEDDGPVSGLEFLRKQTLALQQSAMARPFTGYAASSAAESGNQGDNSPPVRVKEEPEDDLSPAGQQTTASPNGQADWGYDEHFKQVRATPERTLLVLSREKRAEKRATNRKKKYQSLNQMDGDPFVSLLFGLVSHRI